MLGGDNVCHCGACDRHMTAELVEPLISVPLCPLTYMVGHT